jgi:hypothetical protein
MNARLHTSIKYMLLTSGLALLQAAWAAPPDDEVVDVLSADPSAAEQETLNLDVTILGTGFANPVDVTFLVTGTADTGGIVVNEARAYGKTKIIANIDVPLDATVDEFDIDVFLPSNGRGGKGTTLFRVNEKSNGGPTFVSCADAFFGGTPGICLNSAGQECTLEVPNSDHIHKMTEDCYVSQTLVLRHGASLLKTEFNEPVRTLTAVGPFTGTSVVSNFDSADPSNSTHSAQIQNIDIVIDDDASAGCSAAEISSAVHFELNENTTDPFSGGWNPNALMEVEGVTVSTGETNPLCQGIVIRRTQAYNDLYAFDPDDGVDDSLDWRVWVLGAHVTDGSYIEAGIVYEGVLKPAGALTLPYVKDSIVGVPACIDPDVAAGVVFGPFYAFENGAQMTGEMDNNSIDMAADCGDGLHSRGTAIFMRGAPGGSQSLADISNADISGALVGILADDAMVDVLISRNVLTGDGENGTGDIGLCSDAEQGYSEKNGKRNRNTISGYDDDIVLGGCVDP